MFTSQDAGRRAEGHLASHSGFGDHSSLICMFIFPDPMALLEYLWHFLLTDLCTSGSFSLLTSSKGNCSEWNPRLDFGFCLECALWAPFHGSQRGSCFCLPGNNLWGSNPEPPELINWILQYALLWAFRNLKESTECKFFWKKSTRYYFFAYRVGKIQKQNKKVRVWDMGPLFLWDRLQTHRTQFWPTQPPGLRRPALDMDQDPRGPPGAGLFFKCTFLNIGPQLFKVDPTVPLLGM